MDKESCACGAEYKAYRSPYCFADAATSLRVAARSQGIPGEGFRTRRAVLWMLRVMKLQEWYTEHLFCGQFLEMDEEVDSEMEQYPFSDDDSATGPRAVLDLTGDKLTQEQFTEIDSLMQDLIRLGVWPDHSALRIYLRGTAGVGHRYALTEIEASLVIRGMRKLIEDAAREIGSREYLARPA